MVLMAHQVGIVYLNRTGDDLVDLHCCCEFRLHRPMNHSGRIYYLLDSISSEGVSGKVCEVWMLGQKTEVEELVDDSL